VFAFTPRAILTRTAIDIRKRIFLCRSAQNAFLWEAEGATPLRNAAVVGLQATTNIAQATQVYLRYDGEIATGTATMPSMPACA
jgi:uncharacterized protein with beta-barrel porin domain